MEAKVLRFPNPKIAYADRVDQCSESLFATLDARAGTYGSDVVMASLAQVLGFTLKRLYSYDRSTAKAVAKKVARIMKS